MAAERSTDAGQSVCRRQTGGRSRFELSLDKAQPASRKCRQCRRRGSASPGMTSPQKGFAAPGRTRIHTSAIVDPGAKIAATCRIGPFCIVGPHVEMGEGCELISHVTLQGPTVMGNHNRIF